MKKTIILALLLLASPALAQPVTTKPNVSNTLAQCLLNVPVVGNGSGSSPICHASGALGGIAFVVPGTGVTAALASNIGSAGAVVTNGGALGTPSSGTLTNATGLPTTSLIGALQAAQEPAHTGDMTNSAGSLATTVTGINGVNQNTAWTSYTPTITCGTGTPASTTATGAYRLIGKTVLVSLTIAPAPAGTCAVNIHASLPTNAVTTGQSDYAMSVFDKSSGVTGSAAISGATDAATVHIFKYDGTYPTGATPTVTGFYQIP